MNRPARCGNCRHTEADHNTWWHGCGADHLGDPCMCPGWTAETEAERVAREQREEEDAARDWEELCRE